MSLVSGGVLSVGVEEARSALATVIANVLGIVRTIATYILEMVRRIWTWAGEHPLGMLMLVTNVCILLSP